MTDDLEWSATSVWEDFDPYGGDLRIEVLSTVEQHGIAVQELTYVSHVWEEEPVVVYGFLALPPGKTNVPAVLHIHGGGQTASVDHVVEWAGRGYAALSFDWTGPHEAREKVTSFGLASTNKYLVEPEPQFSHLYHGTVIARRGISLLEARPEVDADRIGIYGISWGGFLSWLVNGSDPRVKAAVAIYGCGGTLKRGNTGGADFDPEDDEQRLWSFCYGPYAYAELQNGPMLFLNSTNDFFGWMDTAEDMFTALPSQHALSFCPHFNHHLDNDTQRNLPAWIETHLCGKAEWPEPPDIDLELEGPLFAQATPAAPENVERVDLFCAAHSAPSPSRYWSACPAERDGNTWTAPLGILNPELEHTVFATAFYRSGVSVSSIPLTFRPSDYGAIDELAGLAPVLEDFSEGLGAWYLEGLMPDPFKDKLQLCVTEGPNGGPALTIDTADAGGDRFGWSLATRKIADPRWQARGRNGLYLLLRANCLSPLQVRLTQRPGTLSVEPYLTTVKELDQGWAELEITPDKFKGPEDLELEDFDGTHLLEVLATSPVDDPPVLARVEWFGW